MIKQQWQQKAKKETKTQKWNQFKKKNFYMDKMHKELEMLI